MKILFIVSRFPYPLEKGDKLRAFQHLQHLNASGHEVHMMALSDQFVDESALAKISSMCKSVSVIRLSITDVFFNVIASFLRKMPLQVGYFYSVKNQKRIDAHIQDLQPDLIYCQLIRTAFYMRNISGIPLVLDYMDAFSRGTLQRMKKASWWLLPLFSRELKLVKKFEEDCYRWFHSHLIISEQDRDALAVPLNKPVFVVPNGVDTSFFFPEHADKKVDITFVGNMNYPPNVDGACFLVNEIMPMVWKEFPDATVQVAGANPNKRVRALASGFVFITGWVDDIRHCYRTSKVFVAPMRIGTGLQNKLLEAMAMGIPSVTTPLSFGPLGAAPGKNILVGTGASDLAENIIRLLKDESLRTEIGKKGSEFVIANYSLQHSRLLLDKAINAATHRLKNDNVS